MSTENKILVKRDRSYVHLLVRVMDEETRRNTGKSALHALLKHLFVEEDKSAGLTYGEVVRTAIYNNFAHCSYASHYRKPRRRPLYLRYGDSVPDMSFEEADDNFDISEELMLLPWQETSDICATILFLGGYSHKQVMDFDKEEFVDICGIPRIRYLTDANDAEVTASFLFNGSAITNFVMFKNEVISTLESLRCPLCGYAMKIEMLERIRGTSERLGMPRVYKWLYKNLTEQLVTH